MFSIRATRRLLVRTKVAPTLTPPASTTLLGDWYANLVPLEAGEFIVCVSERTLLPVILPASAVQNLAAELSTALSRMLDDLGVDRALVEKERVAARLLRAAREAADQRAAREVRAELRDQRFGVAAEGIREQHELRLRVAAEWQPADLDATRRLLDEGRLSLAGLITHRAAASDAGAAYETAFTDPTCLKMILDWSASA